MATGFGTNCWIGAGEESTYGTAVARTKFFEPTNETMKGEHSWLGVETLRSPSVIQRVRSKKSVSGGFKARLGYEGFERILKHAFGAVATSTTTPTWTHLFTLSTALPTGLSVEVNRDAAAVGSGSSFLYTGCQITSLTIRQEMESIAEVEVEFVGADFSNVSVSSPTFPTFHQVDYEGFALVYEGTTIPCRSFEFTLENALADDRYKLGSRTRVGLGRSGARSVMAKFQAEFDSLTTYAKYRDLATTGELQVEWSNGLSGASLKSINLNLDNALMVAGTPEVSDAGPILVDYEVQGFAVAANDEVFISLVNSLSSI